MGYASAFQPAGPLNDVLFVSLPWPWYGSKPEAINTGWWFGTSILFSHILGIIIPIDFHIFQRGGPTTNQNSSFEVNEVQPQTAMGQSRQMFFRKGLEICWGHATQVG